MAGAVSVHGSEGHFSPVLVTVRIRPIHSYARLSLLAIFSIGGVPFPGEILCLTSFLGVLAGSLQYKECAYPLPIAWGGVSMHGSQYK